MNAKYHIPVLLKESADGLNINPDGIYVDLTFGSGGHSKEILKKLNKGKLIAFDQDDDVLENVKKISENFKDKFMFFQSNFEYFGNFIRYAGFDKIDGILADLGVSSHQFNTGERGFSFRFDAVPDMRMNVKAKKNSKTILNEYDAEKLKFIFKNYGEIKNTEKLINAIIETREKNRIETVSQLNEIIDKTFKTNKKNKLYAKVYQALRIETNNETEVLKKMLINTAKYIKPGGRLVVISYHSVEDRIVKNFIKFNDFAGNPEKDIYGNIQKEFKEINKKVITPAENEIKKNNRARSAKLRIAEKI